MVTIAEIEERIVELHKRGKTSKQITKEVHKIFTFIGAVLKKRFPEECTNARDGVTKETKARKLFSQRKTPTEVAIKLNESPDLIEKYFADFWRLERMQSVHKLYLQNKKAIPNLLRLYDFLKKRGITTKMYDEFFNFIDDQMIRAHEEASNSDISF